MTIETYAPYGDHCYVFDYHLDVNFASVAKRRKGIMGFCLLALSGLMTLLDRLVPSFGNVMAALVLKPDQNARFPWINEGSGGFTVDQEWVDRKCGLGKRAG